MSAPLVAFSRKLDAIDLTASLWLARLEDASASIQRRILWIADPRGGYTGVQSDLEALSRVMRPVFDIEVISYSEAWQRSICKTPAELFFRLRDNITESASSFPCRIRIHHGSLDVKSGSGEIMRAHCLEFRARGEEKFGVSASGRPGSWATAAPSDIVGISGSLHLYLAAEIGEVVNLPWYALAPSINPVVVRETISPIAFNSADRYSNQDKKLTPTGYSLIDYPHLSIPVFDGKIEIPTASQIDAYSLLMSDYPRTSARIGPRAPGSAELVSKMFSQIRQQVIAGKIAISIYDGTLLSSVPATNIVDSILVVAVVARVLESVDRGHAAAVPPALLDIVHDSGLLDANRPEQIDILLRTHSTLVWTAATLFRAIGEGPLLDARYERFGEIARLCVVSAAACAEAALLDLAVRLKASVPALANVLDGDGFARAFDSLAEVRAHKIAIPVSGSILSDAN